MPKFAVTTPAKVLGKRYQEGAVVNLEADAAEPYLAEGVLDGPLTEGTKAGAKAPSTGKK